MCILKGPSLRARAGIFANYGLGGQKEQKDIQDSLLSIPNAYAKNLNYLCKVLDEANRFTVERVE